MGKYDFEVAFVCALLIVIGGMIIEGSNTTAKTTREGFSMLDSVIVTKDVRCTSYEYYINNTLMLECRGVINGNIQAIKSK